MHTDAYWIDVVYMVYIYLYRLDGCWFAGLLATGWIGLTDWPDWLAG